MPMDKRIACIILAAFCGNIPGVRGQDFFTFSYDGFSTAQDDWVGRRDFTCDGSEQVLPFDGVTLVIQQTSNDHKPCRCEVMKDVDATSTTGIRIYKDEQLATEFTSEWAEGTEAILEFNRVPASQDRKKTQMRLFLGGRSLMFDSPLSIQVYGDFGIECAVPNPTTTMTATTTAISPETMPSGDAHAKVSYRTMQVAMAAILSAVAVAMVTIAVIVLCFYKRHKRKQSNLCMAYKSPPSQPFGDTKQSHIHKTPDLYDNNNEISEVIYDNNITPNQNDSQSKRKPLSFRDTMYANFTAILASIGKSRVTSNTKTKHHELKNQFSVEPRTFVQSSTEQSQQPDPDNDTGVEYADIDVRKLAHVVPKINTSSSKQEDNIVYVDLAFQNQRSGQGHLNSSNLYDNAISFS